MASAILAQKTVVNHCVCLLGRMTQKAEKMLVGIELAEILHLNLWCFFQVNLTIKFLAIFAKVFVFLLTLLTEFGEHFIVFKV